MKSSSLLGLLLRHETRLASDPPGSGARATGYWLLSPIVAVTKTTVVIQFPSGRRCSIKRATGIGTRNHDVVTSLHPDDAAKLG